ncbi:hypothetical protein LCGC14_0890140 [marine sediment metagenome]|uniref:Uncharacterized protein n=1 Tax=marine sediment metagenome TaxID=412755 RepID=A0A0F9RIS8_9ZZZZ
MTVNYIIDFSDPGVPSFVIGPGQTNNDFSIKLYGQGATNYGEGINENLLHMLENFAHTVAPTNPTLGQFWYDKGEGIFKFFNGTDFVSAGSVFVSAGTPPSAPNATGQLWFDTVVPQLKVFNGATFVSVADRYVLKGGDTMTGALILNTNAPTTDEQAASKLYVDNNSLPVTSGTTTVTSFVTIDTSTGTTVGGNDYAFVVDSLSNSNVGGILIDSGDTDGDQFAIRIRNSASATLFSVLSHTTPASASAVFSGNVSSNPAPTVGDHLTNKTYVDGEIAGVTGSFAEINPTSPQDGDIQVLAGPIISIRGDGVWNQVFPAVWS